MSSKNSSYSSIFKSTFLFGFVRLFQILIGIVKNKIIAVLLGSEGVGFIGILTSSVQLLQAGASLGLQQSAVRDISQANTENDFFKFSKVINLVKILLLFTSILGFIITLILSPFLSLWTLGTYNFTIAYLGMSVVVGLSILTEGQLTILKGMRKLNYLAKASIIGSIVGLFTAVPLFYYFGQKGIVPSLILSSISGAIVSNYFVSKINYTRSKLDLSTIIFDGSSIIRMGISLMIVGFLSLLFDLILASYIRHKSGMETVGLYRAGTTIISNYFGIVITAMSTDYYPRISSVHGDNNQLNIEVSRQSQVGYVLITPIAVLFVFLSPLIMKLLYSNEFIDTINYTDYAVFGAVIGLTSNCLGMILIAKREIKFYTTFSSFHYILFIPIYILFFRKFGIAGLGVSYLINVLFQFCIYIVVMWKKYKIRLSNDNLLQIVISLFLIMCSLASRSINHMLISYTLGFVVFFLSCFYSNYYVKKFMNINLVSFLQKKIK